VKNAPRTGPLSVVSVARSDDPPGRIWTFDELATDRDSVADLATGLTSVGFIRAALRRGRWLWCATAVLGTLVGFGVLKELPPADQASTTILLGTNNFVEPGEAAQDDVAIAESRAVAANALLSLGMQESPASFAADYTVTIITDQVIVVTVKAKSSQVAVREANAVARAFIKFQQQNVQATGVDVNTLLQQQIALAQQELNSINREISRVLGQPPSDARAAKLASLRSQATKASTALTALQQGSQGNKVTTQVNADTLVAGTRVLDAAVPLSRHTKKLLVIYVGTGLIAGLVLGMFIVVVRALVSDRLRRRDDVARALDAPVRLSVGKVRLSRRLHGGRGLEAAQSPEIKRIVAHLASSMPHAARGTAALAVVPVDDPQVAALSVASLAWGCAQGMPDLQVLVADLCPGAPAARLLGVQEPGVREVRVEGVPLVVAVPDRDDAVPVGPLGRASTAPAAKRSAFTEAVASAFDSADLLFTLASLDPSLGGDYLAGWAPGAVAVVTAGHSSAERIHAVGEMIRLSGTELISAVLVGADKTDQSLGVTDRSSPPVSIDLA